jgi:hypothetical protein
MGIRQIQTKNLIDVISQSYFIGGVNPQLNDILKYTSSFFAQNPPGLPLKMSRDPFENPTADELALNDLMARTINNIDVLYETCNEQVDELLIINTVLRSHLERLRVRRVVLESKIDDFLLGLYNSDGYFFSISDQFIDSSLTDFNMTTAFVDVESGALSLPPVSNNSSTVRIDRLSDPTVIVTSESGTQLPIDVKTPFFNALDGLTNTAWFFEVRTNVSQTVTAEVSIELSRSYGTSKVTKVDLNPFGVSPVQVGITATFDNEVYNTTSKPFTSAIKKSADKMTFIGEQIDQNVSSMKFILVKNQHDRIEQTSNGTAYVYMFGFKEISLTEQVFDQFATFVSKPLSLPSDYGADAVIDAVSLVTDQVIPTNTSIKYYVASDVAGAEAVGDFSWIEIKPVGQVLNENKERTVSFNGAQKTVKMIRNEKRIASDLQLIPINSTNPDLAKRNPSPAIIAATDMYRLVEFPETFIPGSISLEEGINTTKIYYTDLDTTAITNGFDFWKNKLNDPDSYFTSYGQIDSGNQFFYGGDIGESGKSVFVETYIEVEDDIPVVLKQCLKGDSNSRTWDVKLYLNGREIANMPTGVDRLSVPWKFSKGRNHVALLVNIPDSTLEYPSPYIGTINLMTDSSLDNFGTVKLDTWSYVDFFKLQNNQVNNASSFTIYNGEIISRKKPTNNFRLSYSRSTNAGPSSIRLRADLARVSSQQNATPLVNSYRLRFSYS